MLRRALFIVSIVLASCSSFAQMRAIDGDTVDTGIKPFENLSPIHLRIDGVDTPEIRGKCLKEKSLAKDAKAFVQFTLDNEKDAKVILKTWDKYGGRVVGDIEFHGVSLSSELIRRGFAVPYNGGKKTKDWCL